MQPTDRRLSTRNIRSTTSDLPKTRALSVAYYHKQHPRAKSRDRTSEKSKAIRETIISDKAIQRYFTRIKSRARNDGYISLGSQQFTVYSVRDFLLFLKQPITSTAMSELVKQKSENPLHFTIDDQIEEFANPSTPKDLARRRFMASKIIGILKANRCNIVAKSDTHLHTNPRKPISEGILRAIYLDQDQRHRDIMDLQAYSGQRITALATTKPEEIDLDHDSELAIISVHRKRNKSRRDHVTLVPKSIVQRMIQRSKELNNIVLEPNAEGLWHDITIYAASKYNVRLTSHYLRARFSTIASRTPMDVNEWDYLAGCKKPKGHDADRYNLTFLDDNLLPDYKRYLLKRLAIRQ